MTFEEYLLSKKIDSANFREKEPKVWEVWKSEFEQMHPNSFTVQKLNLINPIRRKYPIKTEVTNSPTQSTLQESTASQIPATPVAKPAKPVFRPKPKI